MIEEHDAHLQRMFDERLMRVLPPPRGRRARRSARRVLGLGAVAMLTAAGLLFAADVNRTADAAGESCADVMAKVELWFESVRNGTTDEQIEIKRRANELIGSVCLLKKAGAANITTIKKPTTGWIEKSPDPRCQAAQDEIRAWSLANPNPSRGELIEFKEKANRLLEAACITSPAKRSP